MNRFPAPGSVLVLDNWSGHNKIRITALCHPFGVLVVYLPPYSYDFSPIEPVFHITKHHMKVRHGQEGDNFLPVQELFRQELITAITKSM